MRYSPDQAIDRRPELLANGLLCIGAAFTTTLFACVLLFLGYCGAGVALAALGLVGVPCCLNTGTRKLYRFWGATEHQHRYTLACASLVRYTRYNVPPFCVWWIY
jgi:hypothetical protein